MKRTFSMLFLVVAAMTPVLFGEDPKPAATETAAPTADLIQAAKGAKERRKTSRTKVITNADVRKSKGKLIENRAPDMAVAEPSKPLTQQHAEKLAAEKAAQARLTLAEKNYADLSKQLASIEQSYYEENDLDRRDRVIAADFAQMKQRVDAAAAELEEARKPFLPPEAAADHPTRNIEPK